MFIFFCSLSIVTDTARKVKG